MAIRFNLFLVNNFDFEDYARTRSSYRLSTNIDCRVHIVIGNYTFCYFSRSLEGIICTICQHIICKFFVRLRIFTVFNIWRQRVLYTK